MLTLILLVISVLLIFVIISLEVNSKMAEEKLQTVKDKLKPDAENYKKYDKWFFQTFFNKKLQAGKRQLSSGINQLNAGKSKLALGEAVKVILIILCTVCVIWAIVRIVKSVIA